MAIWMARVGCGVACILVDVVMLPNIFKKCVCEYFIHLNGWNSI